MGHQALRRGQHARAHNQFRLALNQHPGSIDAKRGLSRAKGLLDREKSDALWLRAEEIAERNLEKALPVFRDALDLHRDPERTLRLVKALIERGLQKSYGTACTELLEAARERAPENGELIWMMVQHHRALGEQELAAESCQRLLEVDPSDPRGLEYQRQHRRRGHTGEWERPKKISREANEPALQEKEREAAKMNSVAPTPLNPGAPLDLSQFDDEAFELEVVYSEAQLNQSPTARRIATETESGEE